MISSTRKVDHIMGVCRDKQYYMNEIRDALILYCQQFAFAPEMAYQCSALLKCAQTKLPTKYPFNGDGSYESHYEAHGGSLAEDSHHGLSSSAHGSSDSSYSDDSHVDPYGGDSQHHLDDHQPEPLSSHGIELYKTGGHVKPAYDVHPELAAAAVTPHEAVIQVGKKSIKAPFEHIDTEKVELACDDKGCALIPDDGNPHNDLIVKGDGDKKIQTRYHDEGDKFKSGSSQKEEHYDGDLPMVGGHV